MGIPDEFSAFWSVIVHPHAFTTITVPDKVTCSLTTGAADVSGTGIESGHVCVFASTSLIKDMVIFSFAIGEFESFAVDLVFRPGERMQFRTEGAAVPVHLSGFLLGGWSVDVTEAPI
jgi:hypothetical protein